MNKAGQTALVILAVVVLLLSMQSLGLARAQQKSDERSTCVLSRRTDWEVSLGAVLSYGLRHPDSAVPESLLEPYEDVQARLEQVTEVCTLETWWQP